MVISVDDAQWADADSIALLAEILRPPRSLAGRAYNDIRRWTVMSRGGHFAAMEQPDALAYEVREFFRPLRSTA